MTIQMRPKPKCSWWVEDEAKEWEGSGTWEGGWWCKCGRDLESSGTRKENVLSEVFQITVATDKPDASLIGCPKSQAVP